MALDHAGEDPSVRRGEQLERCRRPTAQMHPGGAPPGDHVMGLQVLPEGAAERQCPAHRGPEEIRGQEHPGQQSDDLPAGDHRGGGGGLLPALQLGAEGEGEVRRVMRPGRAQPDRAQPHRWGRAVAGRGSVLCGLVGEELAQHGVRQGVAERGVDGHSEGGCGEGGRGSGEGFHASTLAPTGPHGNAPPVPVDERVK